MSGLPSAATETRTSRVGSFVPRADIPVHRLRPIRSPDLGLALPVGMSKATAFAEAGITVALSGVLVAHATAEFAF